jgi:glycosyltransferase involved in cell wall biosynthesis
MIAVVIPCYRVSRHILDVIARIGPECAWIYVVDDACPEASGQLVRRECQDPRVQVIEHAQNQGVGGAVLTGYKAALEQGAQVMVKLDGDGQMDPALIPKLIAPILAGEADYTKGNRFYDLEGLRSMPALRLFGNAALSFLSKLSTGYWNLFDPTNGFTAIHANVARALPAHKLARRWFFESDILFRLGVIRAVVQDMPMPATYAGESSSLRIHHVLFVFAWSHLRNTAKRLFYNYFLRDFSVASLELLLGPLLLGFGLYVGVTHWVEGMYTGVLASSGTVMLAALPILTGTQLVLAFLGYDVRNIPTQTVHRKLAPISGRLLPERLR